MGLNQLNVVDSTSERKHSLLNMKHRRYTYAIYPTPEQETLFNQFAGVCRLVWNLALEQRQNHWRQYQKETGNNLNYYAQITQLKELRADFDFIKAVSQTSQSMTLMALERAFQRFFKGIASYPNFKNKGCRDSFSFVGREIVIEKLNQKWSRVRLPKIGWVKTRITREMYGQITEVTVMASARGWQISFNTKYDENSLMIAGEVGIDRGVSVPLMLSDGTSYHLPAQIEALERKHRKAQRIASRRKHGSNRWRKAIKRAAAVKSKQARIRKHWAHETTTEISRQYGKVVIERLRTKNMTKSASGTVDAPGKNVSQKRGLNRAILNVGWFQVEQMLFYKTNLLKVDPKFTSQTCSSCGSVDSRSRESQAVFVCTCCGYRDNADRNAAINILNRGITPSVEGGSCATAEARTRSRKTEHPSA